MFRFRSSRQQPLTATTEHQEGQNIQQATVKISSSFFLDIGQKNNDLVHFRHQLAWSVDFNFTQKS